jgi:hypothetical protein
MLALSTARGTARRCRPRLGIATWLPPAEKRLMTAVQAVAWKYILFAVTVDA